MPAYKLVYFPARGRAEMIRLAFAYGGIEFEDVRMPGPQLMAAKAAGTVTPPFGQFPYLEVDGASMGQSYSILRFVAKKAGLVPADEVVAAQAESVQEQMNDITNYAISVMYAGLSEEVKATKLEEAKATKLASMLKGVVAYAKASSGPFFFGSEPTVADLAYFSLAEGFTGFMPGCDLNVIAPELVTSFEAVKNHPKLAAYFAKRTEVEAAEAAAKAATAAATATA